MTIRLGFTFDYFIPGVLLIIIGGASCIGNLLIGIAVLLAGVALLLLRSSIEIDRENRRVRKTYQLFSLRFGSWIEISHFSGIALSLTNESQTIQHRGGQTTTRTKTYDLIFFNASGKSKELNDFKSYELALKTQKLIAEELQLNAINGVEEARQAALQRRKEKGYRK